MIQEKTTRALSVTLAALVLFFSANGQAEAHHAPSNSRANESRRRVVRIPIADFSLTDQMGRSLKFGALRGKVVLVTFVYTTCPDTCPLVTSAMRSVQKDLDAWEHDGVFFLSITTDPEIDRPPVLKSYARRYGIDFSNWSFLTGESQKLAPVWKSFGVAVRREARGLVNHTLLTALVDKKGTMRFVYHGATPDPNKMLQDMRRLLSPR